MASKRASLSSVIPPADETPPPSRRPSSQAGSRSRPSAPRSAKPAQGVPRAAASRSNGEKPPEPAGVPARLTAAERYSERINIPVSADMVRALKLGQADDRITTAARIRAMIDLWAEGGRWTKSVDSRARQHKG